MTLIGWIPLILALVVGKYGIDYETLKQDFVEVVKNFTVSDMSDTTAMFLKVSLVCLVLVGISFFLLIQIINMKFRLLTQYNSVDIDAWVQQPEGPATSSKFKLLFAHWMSAGGHVPRTEAVALGEQDSDFMEGLKVSVKEGTPDSIPHSLTLDGRKTRSAKKPIVVGTIRMGFGHHRIAYAACSWSLDSDCDTYFHDFLNIDSPEATLIKDMDKLYSKGSRLSSEIGGPVESLWGSLTLSGDADSLRATYQMGEVAKPLLLNLPKDTPIIATHSLVAHAAVASGFTNVINLVIDNHAQWFIVVPKALNLVQGPTNYCQLLKMGIPPEELRLVGHWIPRDLVNNIPKDCAARIKRAELAKPLRLLIPVGGAGAQRKFVTNLVKALSDLVKEGEVQLFLNAGDHQHMRVAFVEALDAVSLEYGVVDTIEGVHSFCDELLKGKEPKNAVTLFSFKDYFPAVATTDILSRVTDVLACKPSELAFYPVPKLMIRRVGDHEAHSALRASELGDGTLEAREIEDAMRYIDLFKEPGAPLLVSMNEKIIENSKIGIYDGCKNAVEIAKQMS